MPPFPRPALCLPALLAFLAVFLPSLPLAAENEEASPQRSLEAPQQPGQPPAPQRAPVKASAADAARHAVGPQPLRPQATQPAHPLEDGDEMIPNIQYPNGDVRAVIDFYERLTGKRMLYDSTVQGTVNIFITKPVSKEEAIRIVETALLINGFTLVPGPGDIVKVLGLSKNPRQFAVPMFSEMDRLPEGDEVVSFLFKLENADPAEVAAAISPYITPQNPWTLFLPLPKSQALIVTESANVIRSLAQIIAELDHAPAKVVSEFIPLERADAKDVLDKLTAMFEKQPTQGGGAPPAAVPPPPQGESGEAGTPAPAPGTTLSEDSLIVGKIKLTADIRTNRIHVVTRPVNMPFIRRLIAEFDSDLPFGEPTTRPLRFVSAGEVLDIVVKAITEPGGKADEGGGGHTAASPVSNASSSITSGTSSIGSESLNTPEVDTVPEARTVGNTKIIADKRANAIIVLGNQEVKDKIFKVLDQIDVRAPQVMLTAVIGELTLSDNEEFGIDYLLHKGKLQATGSNGIVNIAKGVTGVSSNTSTDLSGLLSAAGIPSSGGLTALIGATKSLDIIVHALESTGRFHVTSRPMVFTSNNKKAIIASGEQIAVPANIQSSYTGSSLLNSGLVSQSNVEYKDVVLKLEVQPLINSDREVTLDIVQEVNSVSGSTLISGNNIPTIASRRIKTTVSVANEATVVLGGLVQETKQDNKSGIPVLNRIPVVGMLFGNKKKALTRTELIVLIRPTVTNGPTEAIKAGEKVQEKLNFPPDLDATLDPPGTRVKARLRAEKVQKLLVTPQPGLRSEK